MEITEFLKGHLCFLPFTLYSINTLLFTTSNLLFFFTLYHLQFTIPGFTIYHFQSTFIFTFYHFQFNITSLFYYIPLPVYMYFYLFYYYFFIPFTIINLINYYIPSWFYYNYTTSLLFFTVTSNFLQPKL